MSACRAAERSAKALAWDLDSVRGTKDARIQEQEQQLEVLSARMQVGRGWGGGGAGGWG